MTKIENRYVRLEWSRKSFITYLTKYHNLIKEEMLQFSLDMNMNHIDEVYMILFECYIPTLKEFKGKVIKIDEESR